MAIARKPKASKELTKEKDITELINKGGSVATDSSRITDEKPVLIRIPSDTLEQIDKTISSKKIKSPRHTWLLEAIFEKLERES